MKRGIFMEKKKIIKRVVIIIIAILVVLLITHIIRNYIIVSKVVEKQCKFFDSNNRSYAIEAHETTNNSLPEKIIHMEIYYREGKSKMVVDTYDNKGNYLEGFTEWEDKKSNERIHISKSSNEATIDEYFGSVSQLDEGFRFHKNTFGYKLKMAVFSFISYEEIDEEKCYKIDRKMQDTDMILYFRVSDGSMKGMATKSAIENQERLEDAIISFKDFKIDNLTEEEMTRLNLTGYDVTNNKITN